MSKDKQAAPPPVEVYPPPVSDRAGERTTAGVSPAAQKPGKAPEEKAEAPVISVAKAVNDADAELARLRARVAELEAEKAKAEPTGEGKKSFKISHPGHAELTVKADDEAGARKAYMAALGVWSLPGDVSLAEDDGKQE